MTDMNSTPTWLLRLLVGCCVVGVLYVLLYIPIVLWIVTGHPLGDGNPAGMDALAQLAVVKSTGFGIGVLAGVIGVPAYRELKERATFRGQFIQKFNRGKR